MRQRFESMSIRSKLMLVILGVSLIIVVLIGGVRLIWDMQQDRAELAREVSSLTHLLADRSSAALVFDDVRLAKENFSSLRTLPHVIQACLYRGDGSLFAAYPADKVQCIETEDKSAERIWFDTERLHVTAAIRQGSDVLGSISLVSNLSPVNKRLNEQISFSVITLLVVGLIAVVMAGWLQRLIAKPMEAVTAAARAIALGGDYNKRAPVSSHDEVGELAQSFNAMLDALQEQTGELTAAKSEQEMLLTKYRSLFDHANDAILLMDAISGKILDTNPAASTLYGYAHDELLAMGISELNTSQEAANVSAFLARLRREGGGIFERLHRTKGGRLIPVEISTRLIELEGRSLFFSVVRDLTERRQAQERIEQSEMKFRTLFDTANVAIVLLHDGYFIDCNPIALEMYQCQREDIIGKSPLTFSPPQQYDGQTSEDKAWEKIYAALQGKAQRFDWLHMRLDGSTFDAEVSLNRIDLDGEPCLQGIILDISARKRAEESLRRAQKMEAVGQLAGGVAHDFNNQLGVVIGYLDFLSGYLAKDEKPRKWVETATQATLRCVALTRQLLAFSRRRVEETRLVDINQELAGMDELISRAITPAITMQTYLGEDLWPVAIDPGEFQDAILNLVINARDAMPKGGKLVIETRNKYIDAHYTAFNPDVSPGEYVQILISDSGCGIDKDTLERVFEPFFTTKPEGKGTGLGLAMVYSFTQRYGGHIKVYSEPGVGTRFHVYLPRMETIRVATDPAESVPNPLPRGTESVLIVDDEVDLLSLASQYLSGLGYRTLVADNVTRAFELLKQHSDIELLFSDVVMPGGISGYELADQAVKINPGLKVLLTSGFTANTVASNSNSKFVAHLLHKPYRKEELARQVRAALDQVSEE